jgi:hypothetical protein
VVNISFIGDISLNDDYIDLYRQGIKPFSRLADELQKADLVVGNLECLAAGNQGENLEKRPRLKTDINTLGYLKEINLGLACLAHNHVYDNLEDGFQQTLDFLQKNGIHHLGASIASGSDYEARSMTYEVPGSDNVPDAGVNLEINGIRFAFFNYVSEDTNPNLPPGSRIRLNVLDVDNVIQDLHRARESDYRILLLHWGGRYENSYFPGPPQIILAKKFIEAGADLIIGHHPHTLQPILLHKGKSVYFSLGNFCFADVHSDGKVKTIRHRRWNESVVVKTAFSEDGYDIELIPFRLKKLHAIKDPAVLRRFRSRQAYFKLIRFSVLFWYIYYFGFKYLRPVIWELKKKDPDRGFIKRLLGLDREKISGLFR